MAILIKLRRKYLEPKVSSGGLYKPRTGRPLRIGYKKGKFRGNSQIPKYERIKKDKK